MMKSMRTTFMVLALALAAVAAMAPVAVAGGTVKEITLRHSSAFPAANGKAKYKVDGTNRELQVEVEDIRRLSGKRVNVFVNGNKIGSPLVNSLGEARLNRDTQKGQAVPHVTSGSPVRVRTQGGTLIVSGTF